MAWGVLMSASNMERKVLRGLAAVGVHAYMPLYLDSRARTRMLFRNYIFAFYNRDRFHHCYHTSGVQRVLMNDDKPALVHDSVIALIRSRETDNGHIELHDKPREARFALGQTLVIQRGAWQGKFAIYKGMTAKARELVLLTMLGKEHTVEMGYEDLAVA